MKDISLFKNSLEQLNIALSDYQIEQFLKYYEMLIEKNKVMNLTAITDFEEVITKHFIDSISIIRVLDLSKPHKLIDLGTGAGFPGIPLKIAFPDLKITLCDSLNKRINFLNEVIDSLKLCNIEAFHGRAEDLGKNIKFREQYDVCVSRAVANLASLSEYCIPFVKLSGLFISYKSGDIDSELKSSEKAIKVLGGNIDNVVNFTLPNSDIERSFVMIKKVNKTAKTYPRNAGKPTKEPIK